MDAEQAKEQAKDPGDEHLVVREGAWDRRAHLASRRSALGDVTLCGQPAGGSAAVHDYHAYHCEDCVRVALAAGHSIAEESPGIWVRLRVHLWPEELS